MAGYIFSWQFAAHYFENWPFSKFIKGRIRQGIASGLLWWVVGTLLTALYFAFYNPVPGDAVANQLTKTLQLFNFMQTVIFAFAVWYFWLENKTPVAGKQPRQGIIMFFALWGISTLLTWGTWGINFAPVKAGTLIPPPGIYITWIWYPAAIGALLAFEGWPLGDFKQPLKGILSILSVTTWTVAIWLILLNLNMDPITFNANGMLFMIIYTFTMLFFSVGLNHFPFRKMSQPSKGIGITALATVAAILVYLITVYIIAVPLTGIAVGTPDYNKAFSAFLIIDMALVFQWGYLFTQGWWYAGYSFQDLTAEPVQQATTETAKK